MYVDKTGILVKCSFRHNISRSRSKNCWMVEGRKYNNFLAFERHSYTQREIFFSSKLHLSLSDRIIIGSKEAQNFRFVIKKISETCDTNHSLHWKVTLGMLYRLTNLYRKQISHVREISFFIYFL